MEDETKDGAAGLPQETGGDNDADRTLEGNDDGGNAGGDGEGGSDTTPGDGEGGDDNGGDGDGKPSDDPIDGWDEDKLDAVLFARDASLINKNLTEDQKRAKLKEFRAIDTRQRKKESTKSPDAPMTVGDFEKANQKDAIKKATTPDPNDSPEIAAAKKEIDENWDGVRVFYANRRGKRTVDDIVEDILDAHAAWKRKNGGSESAEDPAASLARTGVARPGSGPTRPVAKPQKDDPRFKKPGGPEGWFPPTGS